MNIAIEVKLIGVISERLQIVVFIYVYRLMVGVVCLSDVVRDTIFEFHTKTRHEM